MTTIPVPVLEALVNTYPDDDRTERIRQARQVLAGSELRSPREPMSVRAHEGPISIEQRNYLIALGVLLLLAIVIYALAGLGIASAVFFILAIGLIAGWLIF
ncbi:MAG: hypothetical protein H0T49_06625 [Chloroflexia bacterium]|nr:hypothetical protein [Chloroflexia bacterium]